MEGKREDTKGMEKRTGKAEEGRSPDHAGPSPEPADDTAAFVPLGAVAAAIVVCDPAGSIVSLNRRATTLLRVSAEEALGNPALDIPGWKGLVLSEDGTPADLTPAGLLDAARTGEIVDGIVLGLAWDDGRPTTWVRAALEPLANVAGDLEAVVVTIVDLTGLRETKAALREAETAAQDLVETLPDAYLYLNADDTVARVVGGRDAAARDPGHLAAAAPGDHPWKDLPGDAGAKVRQAVALARATGRPVTAEIARVTPTSTRYDEVRHLPRGDGRMLLMVRDITDGKRASEALRASEEKYRTLYLRTPVMLHSIDAQGRLLSVSDRWLQRFGYSADEVLGRSSTEFLTPESRRFAQEEALPAFFASGACEDVAYQMVARDGSIVDVLLSATAERDSGGRVIRSLAVLVDVTEQHSAERERRLADDRAAEGERTMKTLLENVPGMAYRCLNDRNWTVIVLSEGCTELTGYRPEEFMEGAASFATLFHPADAEAVWAAVQEALAARAPWTTTYRIGTRDGDEKRVWERGVGVFDDAGDLQHLEGFITDITDLHEAETALREREEMLSGLVASLPGAAYRSKTDDPWGTVFFSEGCRALTGYGAEEFTGGAVSWKQIVHPDDLQSVVDDMRRDRDGGSPARQTEHRIVTKGGAVRWVLDSSVLIESDADEPAEMVGIVIDVTRLHEAQDAQAESERRLRSLLSTIPGWLYHAQAQSPWADEFIVGGDQSLTGYTPEQLMAPEFEWEKIVHPEDIHLLEDSAIDSLESGRGEAEYRIRSADGEERWVWDRFALIRDADGSPLAQEGILLDVTDRHRAESALRESEQRYRALVDGLPVGVFTYDRELTFLEGNAALEAADGGSPQRYLGASIRRAITDVRPLPALEAALEGREGIYEGPYSTAAGGRELWITLRTVPLHDAGGAIIGGTAVLVDRTEQKTADDRLRTMSLHDPVTGLANRTLLEDRARQALKHAGRKRLSFAVAALQIDRFDTLVSSLGHDAADELLAEVGRRLQRAGRAEDTLAHFGAGRYALLLPGAAGPNEAGAALGKLAAAVGEPARVGKHDLYLTVSLGVAVYPADGVTADELLRNAASALRMAADAGGDCWRFFHAGMNAERADRLALEGELHHALEAGQFFLEYQPVVDAASGEITGVEALVRWRHPERGVIAPLDFIPPAEESGVLLPIGAWVLTEACRQGRAWQRSLGRPLRMGVNISARQLHDESLVDTVRRALRSTRFDAHSLELEITETAAMRDPRHTAQVLGALRAMAVRIALDDFGTGYSSLSHLVRLPISTVKIDRSFIHDLPNVPEHAAVAASVITLGHRLGLAVVAEGVETPGECGVLRDEGCDAIQGFLYSGPLPADECGLLLEAGPILR